MNKQEGILLREKNKHLIGKNLIDGTTIDDIAVVPTDKDLYSLFYEHYLESNFNWKMIDLIPSNDVKVIVYSNLIHGADFPFTIDLENLHKLLPDEKVVLE